MFYSETSLSGFGQALENPPKLNVYNKQNKTFLFITLILSFNVFFLTSFLLFFSVFSSLANVNFI